MPFSCCSLAFSSPHSLLGTSSWLGPKHRISPHRFSKSSKFAACVRMESGSTENARNAVRVRLVAAGNAKTINNAKTAKSGDATINKSNWKTEIQQPPQDPSRFKQVIDSTPVKIGFGFGLALIVSTLWSKMKASRQMVSAVASAINTLNDQDKSIAGIGSSSSAANKATMPTKAKPKKHRTSENANDLLQDKEKKFILLGGKGGVGKSSMSASVATKFADSGQTTLIVSTDPAHSLSDVFDQKLEPGKATPIVGIDNLYAQEIDPEQIKGDFQLLGNGSNLQGSGLDMLGMEELNNLFETLPPGFDEAAALVEIVKYIVGDPQYSKFERIVFDTAPTGHTLRLLSLPEFLDSFLGKIGRIKQKLGDAMGQFSRMFGGGEDLSADLNDQSIDDMKRSMRMVRDIFQDENRTEFIVATIPNMMSIYESARLIEELRANNISVQHVFLNQVQPENTDCEFCSTRHKEQQANMAFITQSFKGLAVSPIQFFDREIRGPYAIRVMADQIFPKQPATLLTGSVNNDGSSGSLSSSSTNEAPSVAQTSQ